MDRRPGPKANPLSNVITVKLSKSDNALRQKAGPDYDVQFKVPLAHSNSLSRGSISRLVVRLQMLVQRQLLIIVGGGYLPEQVNKDETYMYMKILPQ